MSLTAAMRAYAVFLLLIQVVQGQYNWGVTYTSSDICAPEGSAVVLSCSYKHPSMTNGQQLTVQESFWYKVKYGASGDLMTDSEYRGRVTYRCQEKTCNLTITDLRQSDSAQYKFRFTTNQPGGTYTGYPGVTLTVTGLQVSKGYSSLSSQSSCPQPSQLSYIWYKNGEEIRGKTSYYYSDYLSSSDSYSCALQGYPDFPSPPFCVNNDRCNRVTYTKRKICAFRGSSVDISCTYSSNTWINSKFWFRSGLPQDHPRDLKEDSRYSGRVSVSESWGGRSTLRISDLKDTDSAEYRFRFTSEYFEWRSRLHGTTLTVTALQVQVKKITGTYRVQLRCLSSSCSPADRLSYVWNSNRRTISEKTSSLTVWFSLGEEISCALKGHERFPSPPVYAPKDPSVSSDSSAEIVEEGSVTLTCSSDANPVANFTWYKRNKDSDSQPFRLGAQLVFSSIQPSDSGEFYCEAENQLGKRRSEPFILDVKYAPKVHSVSMMGETVEGSPVILNCTSDANPKATNTWYKEDHMLPQGQKGIYSFPSIRSNDSGIYFCMSKNNHGQRNSTSIRIDVQYAPRLPSVSLDPPGDIMEGTSVTLTCSSDANPPANYTWYRINDQTPKISGPVFTISNVRSEDSGNYSCEADNSRGRHNSTVTLVVVSSSVKSVAVGSITAILLVIFVLLLVLFIRRQRSSKGKNKPGGRPGSERQLNVASADENSSASQRQAAEDQDDLCYTSVRFAKKQEEPLYSNISLAKPHRPKRKEEEEEEEEEEDDVEYSIVISKTESRNGGAEEDSAVYSSVMKTPRV